MNINEYLKLTSEDEKPLDNLVEGYSNTSVFRRIAFIGDSLSSGEFEAKDKEGNTTFNDLYEYSWGQYIARHNGLTAYNFSKGGMSAEQYLNSFADAGGLWDKEKACQAYVIALGVNDLYNQRKPIGSLDDIDFDDHNNNKETFAGQYAKIVARYKEISPDAKFFFVTFPKPAREGMEHVALGMRDFLYALAERLENCYVIDLYKYGPEYDEEFRKRYFLYGHMNPSGYILTARMIDSYIDYIVRHNPLDFKNAGFIGTGIKCK